MHIPVIITNMPLRRSRHCKSFHRPKRGVPPSSAEINSSKASIRKFLEYLHFLATFHAGVACPCAFKGDCTYCDSISCMPVEPVRLLPPQRQDAPIYNQHCSAGYLHDYALFKHLLTRKHRNIVSPVPDWRRHGETGFLTPLIV